MTALAYFNWFLQLTFLFWPLICWLFPQKRHPAVPS
jgi:hypothetical protein